MGVSCLSALRIERRAAAGMGDGNRDHAGMKPPCDFALEPVAGCGAMIRSGANVPTRRTIAGAAQAENQVEVVGRRRELRQRHEGDVGVHTTWKCGDIETSDVSKGVYRDCASARVTSPKA